MMKLDQMSLEVALMRERQQHKLFSVTDAAAVGGLVMGVATIVAVDELLRQRSFPVPDELSKQLEEWGTVSNEDAVQVCRWSHEGDRVVQMPPRYGLAG